MTDYTKSAVYVFRSFLASELFSEGVLVQAQYYLNGMNTPISPVIPVQDIPEFTGELSARTYLVYDLITDVDSEQWWHQTDEVTLNIISENIQKQHEIIEFLKERFSRGDLTADRINAYAVSQGSPFRFQHFYLAEASVSRAANSEGGRVSAPAVIIYSYRRLAS
jgi:hypothetical protein